MTLTATPGTIAAVLEVSAGEEGYVEQGGPDGRSGNITKYWADTDPPFQGASWCADFVSWVFIFAGCPLPPIDHQFGFTYCPDMVAAGRHNGWVIPGPVPGAIVLYIESGIAAHTGICRTTADPSGNFWTTEGNTSSGSGGSQSNGGGVYRRLRNLSGIGGGGCVFVMPPVYHTSNAPQEDDMYAFAGNCPAGKTTEIVLPPSPTKDVIVAFAHDPGDAGIADEKVVWNSVPWNDALQKGWAYENDDLKVGGPSSSVIVLKASHFPYALSATPNLEVGWAAWEAA